MQSSEFSNCNICPYDTNFWPRPVQFTLHSHSRSTRPDVKWSAVPMIFSQGKSWIRFQWPTWWPWHSVKIVISTGTTRGTFKPWLMWNKTFQTKLLWGPMICRTRWVRTGIKDQADRGQGCVWKVGFPSSAFTFLVYSVLKTSTQQRTPDFTILRSVLNLFSQRYSGGSKADHSSNLLMHRSLDGFLPFPSLPCHSCLSLTKAPGVIPSNKLFLLKILL